MNEINNLRNFVPLAKDEKLIGDEKAVTGSN